MIKRYQEQILNIYENIRKVEASSLKTRRKEIEERYPELINLERKIGKLSVELAMISFKDINNKEAEFKRIRKSITDLRVMKAELLVSHGFSPDYLDLHYRCTKCKDTGFIVTKKCSCFNQKLVNLYYKDSRLSDVLKYENFSNFDLSLFKSYIIGKEKYSPRKNMETIRAKSIAYADNFKFSNENILFYGTSGTGKTFLTHCIARELLEKGFLVVYRTAEELISDLRSIRYSNEPSLEDLIYNCDLLVIDDLGSENINDFSKIELFNLINKKLLIKKKMLISTNLTLEQLLQTYSERITSRLLGNFDISKFYGEDIRIQNNLKKIQST